MAVALMTRGPLTAYSIFLMQGFMLSRVTVAGAVAAMLELVLERFLADTTSFCLKLIIVRWVATNTRPGSGSPPATTRQKYYMSIIYRMKMVCLKKP